MVNGTAIQQTTVNKSALEKARAYWSDSSVVRDRTGEQCLESVVKTAEVVTSALLAGGKLIICGNGGSAADSQHLAGEFVSVLDRKNLRPALAAIALTTDTSILTAIANDFGYEHVFERQVEALGRTGDVLMGITTSGNSEGVLRAVEAARRLNIATIALTGGSGGKIRDLADVVVRIPSDSTQHTQEMHLVIEHLITSLVEQSLFGEDRNGN